MTATISTAISTMQSGAPVTSDGHSRSVGADGATILTDHYLVEKFAQFNRERVPERVAHAKGGAAFGTFQIIDGNSMVIESDEAPRPSARLTPEGHV
ncbi:catalase [Arthrobacter sp. V4I6]|nr:catalase [Arthrobacter sp. V1I7]MDQ0853428.1 catalase [Arthrobacter sp. V4I6]